MEIVLAAWLAVVVSGLVLEALEARHRARHEGRVPPELEQAVDAATLRRSAAYARDRARLRVVQALVTNAGVGLFLFGGGLAALDAATHGRLAAGAAEARVEQPVQAARAALAVPPDLGRFLVEGLFFVGVLVVLVTLAELPFGWWVDFRIEARHGFNRTPPRLWVADRVKGSLVSIAIAAVVTSAALGLVWWSPGHWWLWVWGFSVAFSVFLLYISPYVIEPLFFRFEPVTLPGLADDLRELAERAGLRVDRVSQVDASRRSRHSNAYFTGIGRVKRIVLYDTLVETLLPGEIAGVLAHEIGHWKLRHVLRRLVANAGVTLGGLWIAFHLARWPGLPGLVGMEVAGFPARAVILGFLASLAALPFAPLVSGLSRRDERAADRFAIRLTGRPADLADALARLARANLANLHPHPVYAWFFHSHPPVTERIRALRAAGASGPGGPAG